MPSLDLTKKVRYADNERLDLNDKLAEDTLLEETLYAFLNKGFALDTEATSGRDRHGRVLFGWRSAQSPGPNPAHTFVVAAEPGFAVNRAGEVLIRDGSGTLSTPITSNCINLVHAYYDETTSDNDARRFYAGGTEITDNTDTRITRTAGLFVSTVSLPHTVVLSDFLTSTTIGGTVRQLIPLYAVATNGSGDITYIQDWRPMWAPGVGSGTSNYYDVSSPDLPFDFTPVDTATLGMINVRSAFIALADRIQQIKHSTTWNDDIIRGLDVGFSPAPVQYAVRVRDQYFGLDATDSNVVKLLLDNGDSISYTRDLNVLDFNAGGGRVRVTSSSELLVGPSGTPYFGLLYNSGITPALRFADDDYLQYNTTTNNYSFRIAGTEVLNIDSEGTLFLAKSSAFTLSFISAGVPGLTFDSGDYLKYTRSSNAYDFMVGGVSALQITASTLTTTVSTITASSATMTAVGGVFTDGLIVGYTATPSADEIRLGDANFKLLYGATYPSLTFDSGDYLVYNRSSNIFGFTIGSASYVLISANKLTLGSTVGTYPLHVTSGFAGSLGDTAGAGANVASFDGAVTTGSEIIRTLFHSYRCVAGSDTLGVRFGMTFRCETSGVFGLVAYGGSASLSSTYGFGAHICIGPTSLSGTPSLFVEASRTSILNGNLYFKNNSQSNVYWASTSNFTATAQIGASGTSGSELLLRSFGGMVQIRSGEATQTLGIKLLGSATNNLAVASYCADITAGSDIWFVTGPSSTSAFAINRWAYSESAYVVDLVVSFGTSDSSLHSNWLPYHNNSLTLGSSTTYWSTVYCNTLRYKSAPTTFDDFDDLALIDSYEPTASTVELEKGGEKRAVKLGKNFPWPMLGDAAKKEDGSDDGYFFDAGDSVCFLLGAIKQLHAKHKKEISALQAQLDRLEKRVN